MINKRFIKVRLHIIIIHQTPPSRKGTSNIVEHRALYGNDRANKLMGIEFEATGLKTHYDPLCPAGFYFFRHGNIAWALEEDTFDTKSQEREFRNNVECRSVGGFKKEGVDLTAFEMGLVLKEIEDQCQKKSPFPFGEQRFVGALGSNVYLTKKNQKQPWFQIKRTKQVEIQPQITYQVGLDEIENLLWRMCFHGHEKNRIFCEKIGLFPVKFPRPMPREQQETQTSTASAATMATLVRLQGLARKSGVAECAEATKQRNDLFLQKPREFLTKKLSHLA